MVMHVLFGQKSYVLKPINQNIQNCIGIVLGGPFAEMYPSVTSSIAEYLPA
jgi:hypothetical protein